MSLKQQLLRQAQFFHPQKKYAFLRGGNNPAAHAALFGVREVFYQSLLNEFESNVARACEELCQNQEFCDIITNLDIPSEGSIVVIGDSLTDDSQSWFSILQRAFHSLRPQDKIKFHNLAVSGDGTPQLQWSVIEALQLDACIYFVFTGTNDGRIQGYEHGHTLTSLSESTRNIKQSIEFIGKRSNAPWIWLTPVGSDSKRIDEHDFFKPLEATWDNQHIDRVADIIAEHAPNCLDLRKDFTPIIDSPLMDEDGLHWSIEGQKLATKLIVDQLDKILKK